MIEALCTTNRAFHGVDNRGEQARKEAFAAALPTILSRATEPALRRRVLEQADDKQLADASTCRSGRAAWCTASAWW